jgi:hypothetical protein
MFITIDQCYIVYYRYFMHEMFSKEQNNYLRSHLCTIQLWLPTSQTRDGDMDEGILCVR